MGRIGVQQKQRANGCTRAENMHLRARQLSDRIFTRGILTRLFLSCNPSKRFRTTEGLGTQPHLTLVMLPTVGRGRVEGATAVMVRLLFALASEILSVKLHSRHSGLK